MENLLRLENINMIFKKKQGVLKKDKHIHVLKNVNLTIHKGEIVALVGESGCGKTTLGRIITGLIKPTSGKIYLEDKEVSGLLSKKISSYHAVQFIQQDSYAALNPVRTIYQSLYAPLRTKYKLWTPKQIDEKIEYLMNLIGLIPSEQFLTKYPHQLSGGQRQRVLMARAVSLEPKLIVADEPVSMIDVSLRLSLLKLMQKLNKELNLSFVYITHDLSTARYIAQNGRMAVMYLGEIVEMGMIESILKNPRHPYTQALIQAVPVPNPLYNKNDELPLKSMELADLNNRCEGCSFAPRCLYEREKCHQEVDYVDFDGVLVKCTKYEKES